MNVALFLEIKNEYTEHLVDTLTPFIYEGLGSYYNEAVGIVEKGAQNDKVLLIFQKLLQSIDGWSQNKIEEETNRIKQMSGTSEYLDDLVRGVVKSNIILLTYSNNISNIIAQTFYNSLSTSTLIHRCYIECAKDAHNNPFLFFHDVSPMDLKRNQIIIEKNIQNAIVRGVRKILPIGLMLKEYLANSINIICESPNVELVGKDNGVGPDGTGPDGTKPVANIQPLDQNIPDVKTPQNLPQNAGKNIPSDKKNKIEKDIIDMVKTENRKSDKEKVQALMQLEKVINSVEVKVNKKSIQTPKMEGGRKKYLEDSQEKSFRYTPNKRLNKSDKAVININFGSETTEETSSKHSSTKSLTSMSDRVHTKHISRHAKSDYIEEYGMPSESVKKNNRHK